MSGQREATEAAPEAEWARALGDIMAFNSRDWAEDRADAALWGIIVGWDDDDPESSAMDEVAARHGWSAETVARMRRLHEQFAAASVRAALLGES